MLKLIIDAETTKNPKHYKYSFLRFYNEFKFMEDDQ